MRQCWPRLEPASIPRQRPLPAQHAQADPQTEVNAATGALVTYLCGGSSDFGISDPSALVAAGQRIWVANDDASTLTVRPPG
jgi:hypothetical protein